MHAEAPVADMERKTAIYYAHERPEMLAFIPDTPKRVLDVGCSEGRFGAQLKARGAEVWGIELDAAAAARASERLDRVLVGPAEKCLDDVPDASFDRIICNDVLEHLVDPYTVLARLRKKLVPGGAVVASIPNVRFLPVLFELLVQKDWRYQDEGVMDKTHLRFFTQRSIRAAFEGAGYRVEELAGINPMAGWKFVVFNVLTLGMMRDTRWQQFAVVARA